MQSQHPAGRALGHYFELLPGGVGKDRSQADRGGADRGGGAADEWQVGVGRRETDEVWTERKQRT